MICYYAFQLWVGNYSWCTSNFLKNRLVHTIDQLPKITTRLAALLPNVNSSPAPWQEVLITVLCGKNEALLRLCWHPRVVARQAPRGINKRAVAKNGAGQTSHQLWGDKRGCNATYSIHATSLPLRFRLFWRVSRREHIVIAESIHLALITLFFRL